MRGWKTLLVRALAASGMQSLGPQETQSIGDGIVYQLGNVSYFANAKHPRRILGITNGTATNRLRAMTAIVTNDTQVTGDILQRTLAGYLVGDDVTTSEFFGNIYVTSSLSHARLDDSAVLYLDNIGADHIYVDSASFHDVPRHFLSVTDRSKTPPMAGPFTAIASDGELTVLDTYRMYEDEYRTFITGSYLSNQDTGSFSSLPLMSPRVWAPMIPVPSRIYSWGDQRRLAGVRVAVKDLFDIQGLQTSAGSQAWIRVTAMANTTAPSIQRLLDLGAVVVGKYKLAQFASGANPWDWVDEQHPFNPRGDGYLTCAASSSGGGCSVAAYDWLDAAVGTDTAVSMRRPAAASGTYGNRPSQGIISLAGVLPVNWAQDTAGVFARDPVAWVKFAKAWYSPGLYQDPSITGLSPLSVADTTKFPSRILYPDEYFPLANPAAQDIVDKFIDQMSGVFNMTVQRFNFTATVGNAAIYPNTTSVWDELFNATSTLTYWSQHVGVSEPLVTKWKAQHEGRFPPVDPEWRAEWTHFDVSRITQAAYDVALRSKAMAVNWFETHMLYETPQSCSESVFLCDIGTGGLPSFRERELNNSPNATFLGMVPSGAVLSCGIICPLFGCTDFTIPLGQVSHQSPVTMHTEQIPVSINLMARRGCDFMLFNMVEKLAEVGILRAVKTGREAF
ncbi:hypothetical protein FE257_009094 [Aspergillus nanangensis]|uniref:Amidase domain-containing protein n=1 Tax=Aspergillus nanangensis TaxID=2582783 RepID=A0AAD4CWP8_ASPNN|nr:hypothetical protein FE257_009094 [Aspergillus nanangensis]